MSPPGIMAPIPVASEMTGADLEGLRKSLGITQAELASRLGLSRSLLHDYARGFSRGTGRPRPIPRTVWLACLALAAGLDQTSPQEPRK